MRKVGIVGLILCAVLALVVITAPKADALTGCNSQVVNKAQPWAVDVAYPYTSIKKTAQVATIRLTATMVYAYCPNGSRADKVMPLGWTLCHLHVSDNASFLFDGVKIEPFVADDNKELVVPEARIQDGDGGEQVCIDWYPAPERKWFLLQNSAGTSVSAWIVFRLHPDMDVTFTWYDETVRYFHPLEDMNVSGWYTWGGTET